MNSYDLLNLLGKIDRKYYDEALGGDPQKPLKIDVSRKPVKWYQIAAPLAACLVVAAGIIIAPRIIDHIRTADPNIVISDPDVSISEPTFISDPKSYYDDYPLLDYTEIPLYNSFDEVIDVSPTNMTVSVTKYGDYDVCISAENVFFIEYPTDHRAVYAKNICLNLVKNGERISYAKFPDKKIPPSEETNTKYDYEVSPYNEPKSTVKIYELNGINEQYGFTAAAALLGGSEEAGAFFLIKDEKITLLHGTDIAGEDSGALTLSEDLTADGVRITDNGNGREYQFDLDTFSDITADVPNYSTHLIDATTDIDGEIVKVYWEWLSSDDYSAGTEKDARDFKNYLNGLEKFSVVVDLYDPEDTEKTLTARQVSDIMEMVTTAKLVTSKYAEPFSAISDRINLLDENEKCIVTINLQGNLSATYNDKTFFFETEDDLRRKLHDIVEVEFPEDTSQHRNEGISAIGNVTADAEDIQNWKNFINSAQVSRIEVSDDLSERSAAISDIQGFMNILRANEPKILPADENPWSGSSPLVFHAFDQDGNSLFRLSYSAGGSGWTTVLYKDKGLSYRFIVRDDKAFMDYFDAIEYQLY